MASVIENMKIKKNVKLKRRRRYIKYDFSKLSPNFIELALDYFDTEEFALLREKYGKRNNITSI